MSDKRYYYPLTLFLMGIVFYLLNYFTPLGGDDYAYCFYFDNFSTEVRPTSERVTTFGMLLESMWNHYQIVNGRFVTHLFVQGFCALWGKGIFNIVNTLVFLAFLHVIVLLSNHKNSIQVLALVFLSSMCILPFPGQTMLWIAGSLNYLWPTTAALWYIYWMQKYVPKKEKIWKHFLAGLVGLAIAWTNESISIPVALGLSFLVLVCRSFFRGLRISSFIGYVLGVLLIVLSPGTFNRIDSDPALFQPLDFEQIVFLHTYHTLYYFSVSIFPLIILVGYIFLFFKSYIKHPLRMLQDNIYFCIFLAFVLFLWALGMDDAARIHFGVSVFSLVVLLHWTGPVLSKLSTNRFVTILLCLLCTIPSYFAISATHNYSIADANAKAVVLAAPEQCIIRQPHKPAPSRFCYYGGMESLGPNRYEYHTRVKAFYYHKDYIQALPTEVYEAWQNGDLTTIESMHVLPLSPDRIVHKSVSAKYTYPDESSELRPYQRIIRRLFNTLSNTSFKGAYYIDSDSISYLLFPKTQEAVKVEIPVLDGEVIRMKEYND